MPRVARKVAENQFKDAVEEVTAALKALPDNPKLRLKRAEIQLQAAAKRRPGTGELRPRGFPTLSVS